MTGLTWPGGLAKEANSITDFSDAINRFECLFFERLRFIELLGGDRLLLACFRFTPCRLRFLTLCVL
jgi:hypothetical protein